MNIETITLLYKAVDLLKNHADDDFVSKNEAANVASQLEKLIASSDQVNLINPMMADIFKELFRAKSKHPNFPTDVIHQVAIVAEESGEAVRAAVNYIYESAPLLNVKTELIQTVVTCIRALDMHYEKG